MKHSQISKTDAFELIGHSNPAGEYPSPVVPVGRKDGQYFAVYLNNEGKCTLSEIRPELIEKKASGFIRYDKTYSDLINNFKPTEQRLYALSEKNVKSYKCKPTEQRNFFYEILKSDNFFDNFPFAALDISELVGDAKLVNKAELKCYEYFSALDKEAAIDWYTDERGRDFSLISKERREENTKKKPLYYGTGRRKTAVARVFATLGSGKFIINNLPVEQYFGRKTDEMIAMQPLALLGKTSHFDIVTTVRGGGSSGQAGAIRHGLTRALMVYDEGLRPPLKNAGYVTRDSREVERKKVGLHKARKRPQYSKR